jgi:hypothetical protein
MTFTIDTYTLNVLDFTEESNPTSAQWYAWENDALKLKNFVYGLKRRWRLRCVEKNVAWNNSAAKYLREKCQSGTSVTFTVDEGDKYQLSATSVVILSITIEMETSQNIRYFSVTLKEV